MGSFQRNAFNPSELEIVEQAYEAAWAEIVALHPLRDSSQDEELKRGLRRRIFAAIGFGPSDSDSLRDRVLASMPEYWALTERRAPRA
jgi:hypothetical protein